jgi:integrase
VVPKLGSLRLHDVTADHLRRLHRSLSKTPVEANRTLTALSAVFGWADRAELLPPGTNPTRYVERYAETGTRRAFTHEELAALGTALRDAEERQEIHPSAILAIRLLALTGMRRSEILGHTMRNRRGAREGLRWGDVDLDAGTVTLHDSKTGRQARVIGAAAVELLQAAKPKDAAATDPVCPGTVQGQPFVGIDKARKRLWKAAGLDGVDLHSLRHAFASIGAHVDGGRYVGMVAPLLGHGHQSRAITERYITSNPEALRPAADAIAAELSRTMALTTAAT